MTVRARVFFLAGVLAVAAVGMAQAHHSVTGSFDTKKTIEITGEVIEWRFRNPHTLLVVDGTAVIDGARDDVKRRWEIESSAAAGLRPAGVNESTFTRGARVIVKGIPHRNATTYRANAFASDGSFLDANGKSIFGGAESQPASPVAATGVGAQRLAGLWRPPFQPNPATTPLALTAAGREAWERYDQKLSPANTCESMSIPDIYNAPNYIVTIEIADKQAVVRNQAYQVVRTIPLDGSEAPADPKQQFGIVRGRIDNGALVIESRAYPASAWGLGAATQIHGRRRRRAVEPAEDSRRAVLGGPGRAHAHLRVHGQRSRVSHGAVQPSAWSGRACRTTRRSIRTTATSRVHRSSRATDRA